MCVPCCWAAVPLVGSLLLACAFSQHSLFGGRSANAFSLIAWYLGFSTLVPNLFFSLSSYRWELSQSILSKALAFHLVIFLFEVSFSSYTYPFPCEKGRLVPLRACGTQRPTCGRFSLCIMRVLGIEFWLPDLASSFFLPAEPSCNT